MSDKSHQGDTVTHKRSCSRCNERKVRCDRKSPCGACAQAGHRCVFPGPKRAPRTLNRPPVQQLLARLAELESEVQQLQSKGSESQKDSQSDRSPHTSDDQNFDLSRSNPGSINLFGGIFRHSNYSWAHDTFSQHYFQPSQIEKFWHIYYKNVAPLIAVLHLPTVSELVQFAKNGLPLDPPREALLLSVCFAAVVSLSADQLYLELGLDYCKAKSAYELALTQALNRAELLKCPGILTLQAAVLYLLCARVDGNTRLVWAESAVIIRLAQGQGIHRDGTKTGKSPFDTEICRRLWWHICILDMLCSEDQSVDMQIRPGTFDTQLPINVNGDELETFMLELPPEKKGYTDITLCIVTCVMIEEMHFARNPLSPALSLEGGRIKSIGDSLHEKYLNHFDLDIPIHWVTATISRLQLSKSWVLAHLQPSLKPDDSSLLHKKSVFHTAIELLEFTNFLQTNDYTAQWSWLCRSYKQKETVSYILDELTSQARFPETDRAWHAVDQTVSLWRQNPKGSSEGSETRLLELIRRADRLREQQLN